MSDPKVDRGTVDAAPIGLFIPAVDSQLTIDLPGERTRATVRRVVDENTVIVELTTTPMMNKSHSYRFKQLIPVRRSMSGDDLRAAGSPDSWAVVEQVTTLADVHIPPPPAPIKETKHAAVPGLEPRGGESKHQRNGRKRSSAKPGRGSKSQQRAPSSKLPRRPGGARGR